MEVYIFAIFIIEILTKTLLSQFDMVDTLKAWCQQQYPHYDQLVTSYTKQQSSDRPTMYNAIVQSERIGAA